MTFYNPEKIRTMSHPNKLGDIPFFNKNRFNGINEIINTESWNVGNALSPASLTDEKYYLTNPSLKSPSAASVRTITSPQIINVSSGDKFVIKMWVNRSSDFNGQASNSKLRIQDSLGGITNVSYGVDVPGFNTWVFIYRTYTVPVNVTSINIRFTSDHTAGVIYISDFAFSRAINNDTRVGWEYANRIENVESRYTPVGNLDPWYIGSEYNDPNAAMNLALVDSDTNTIVDLALKYKLFNDAVALDSIIGIINAWLKIKIISSDGATPLAWASRFPKILQAAMMIRDAQDYTFSLHSKLVDFARKTLYLSPSDRENNWAAWGCVQEISCATFIGDRELLMSGISRWRTLFDSSVVNNIPINEIYRQGGSQGNGSTGLWYSNFHLEGLTIAAEWARFAGEWLYDYKSINGSSFKEFYENVRHWTRYPDQYPYNSSGTPSVTVRTMAHDDILNALWPDDESQWLIDNFPQGSDRDCYGMRQYVLAYRYRPLYG